MYYELEEVSLFSSLVSVLSPSVKLKGSMSEQQ